MARAGFCRSRGWCHGAAQGYDAAERTAFLWAREPAVLSHWGEHTKPFLEIFHSWLIDSPWQPIHGGAVGGHDGGVLLAGGSGVGKSTTVLSCVRAGWLYAGRDYLAIRTSGDEAYVDNLYGSARLCVDMADRFSRVSRGGSRGRLDERHRKAGHDPGPGSAGSRFGGFPIRAILLPRITGGARSALRPASPGPGDGGHRGDDDAPPPRGCGRGV